VVREDATDPERSTPEIAGLEAIAGLADGLRRSLYQFVVAQPDPVGKDQVAEHAAISRSLAAYHLDRLAHDGLLTVTFARLGGRRGPGAGRPAKLYAAARAEVSVQLPPRDDALLARLFAGAVEADASGTTRTALVEGARAEGRRAAIEYRASEYRVSDDHVSGNRLSENERTAEALTGLLTGRGYAPRVCEDEIRMRNCPFHHLVDQHRDLVCGLNLALLDAALGALDEQYSSATGFRAVLEPAVDHCCVVLRRTEGPERA
jgi:predicted ArsR family transcriptional regulator